MRKLFFFPFVIGLVFGSSPAAAQEADIISRLMGHPVTVFDWGMAQLDRDIARAGKRLFPEGTARKSVRTGVIYSWRQQRITIFLSATVPVGQRTRDECRNLFERIGKELAVGLPTGNNAAEHYLESAFKPVGSRWAGRFENIGARLAEIVRLEITLLPSSYLALSGDSNRIACESRVGAPGDTILFKANS